MPRIGSALFAHQRPDQILRIAKRLATTLESAPTCRLDFDRCPLDVRTFPAEVRFVRSQVATRRGGFSPVEATAAVLRSPDDGGPVPDLARKPAPHDPVLDHRAAPANSRAPSAKS